MNDKQIAKVLLMLAKENGYKIGEFEEALEIPIGYFSRIKNGTTLSFNIIRKSVEVLKLDKLSILFAELEKYADTKLCPICSGLMEKKDDKYYCDKCDIEFKFSKGE